MTSSDSIISFIDEISVTLGPEVGPEEQAVVRQHFESFTQDEHSATDIEVHSAFLEHCVKHNPAVASTVLTAFAKKFGIDQDANNIHVVVSKHRLEEPGARLVLRAYYSLWDRNPDHYSWHPKRDNDQLSSSVSMDAIAVFSDIYSDSGSQMDEITWLYDVYCPLLRDYVASMSAFMDSIAKDGQAALAYPDGLDIFGWLSKPSSAPATEYLSQDAVSAPLFGLKQFMRIMVLYKTLGMSPGQFVDQFKAIIGHGHGLAIAAAFSTLTDESSFYTVSKKVLGILLLAGAMPHNAQMANSMTGMAVANGDARSMVLVQGISVGDLNKSVTEFNKRQSADIDCVHMALADVGDTPIVAAKQSAATRFMNHLQHERIKDSNIAASGCSDSLESLVRTANDNGWALDSSNMRLPVYTIDGGRSICDEPDLTKCLLEHSCNPPAGLVQVSTDCAGSRIVVFGSSKPTGFEHLVHRFVEGTGASVVHANVTVQDTLYPHIGGAASLYSQHGDDSSASPDWHSLFSPKPVRTAFDKRLHVDTRMHRVLGKPPVMVVGRLPKVDNGKQIADVYNAGYHIEIDGSDLNSEAIMLQSFTGIASQLQPGHGVTFNCSFSDQELWSIQFPTVLRMCKEGMPIAGICVGDCVPPLKDIVGIIGTLGAVGVRHVSFKPKDADGILQVVRIAQTSNGFPILLQWTHKKDPRFSFEGFVRPLLETYAAVRSCDNLALAVESRDTSDFSDALPYFTGKWSSRYGRIPMPIDGVLLDSSSFNCSLCEKGRAVPTGQIVYNDKDITSAMDDLYRSVVASVIEHEYILDESRVPTVEYIGNDPRKVLLPDSVHVESSTSEKVFELPDDANSLPEHEIWLQALGGGRKSWLQQLLTVPVVIQGNRCVPNPVRQVMHPLPGQTVTLSTTDDMVHTVEIVSDNTPRVTIKRCLDSGDISVTVYYMVKGVRRGTQTEYYYCPEQQFAPIHQYMDRLSNAVRLYYHELWYPLYGFIDKHETITGFSEHFDSDEPAVSKKRIRDFCQNVNSSVDYYSSGSEDQWPLPIEFAYFVSFPGTIRTLIVPAVGNYHPVFVPLYHRIELISENKLFCSDTAIQTRHSVDELFNTPAGKQIKISSLVHCNGKPVARTSTAFLGIGGFVETTKSFSKTYSQTILARFPTREDVKALELKEWFSYTSGESPRIVSGSLLKFCFDTVCRFQDTGVYSSVTTTGSAVLLQANGRRVHIANISLQTEVPCTSNPVVDLLQQYATTDGSYVFASGGIPMALPESTVARPHITVTESLDEFATISSDHNPVHVNTYYAGLKGLPGVVAHAIWVGAATRAVINKYALEGDSDRVRNLTVKVAAVVSPGDKLSVSVRHIGMASGLIQAQSITTRLDGKPVLICDLEIEQTKTAYIFTGQQDVPAVGTGMSLYEQSNLAKDVWDCADRYMLEEYGISLLDVVRNNPESVNVSFEGDKGCRLLEKYTTFLTNDSLDEHQQCTFKSPGGVLDLLQFSQLVHAVDAMANIADKRSKGLVQKGALFAGCSLGEITALASLGCGLLSVEEAVDIVFHRGLLMQSAIKEENSRLSGATNVGVEDALLHSSKMLPHVEAVRNKLQTHIHASNVDLSALQHCYVPNLTGKPFELSKSYVEHAYEITQSTILERVIDGWQSVDLDNTSEKGRIATELLVELLAFQMAYPTQWSSTQQHICKEQSVRRLIEISSNSPRSYEALDDNVCHLHIIRDRKALYYDQSS